MTGFWMLLVVKSTVVLSLGVAAAWTCRRRSAAARHLIWWSALAALLMLPAGKLLDRVAPPGWTVHVRASAANGPRSSAAPRDPAPWLAAVWAFGFAAAMARLSATALGAVRLVRRARIVPGFDGLDVRVSDSVPTAAAWSFGRQIILLPGGATKWPAERLDAAVEHERAHLRRKDCQALLTAELACAVYWFHPLVWYAAHRLRVEQEHAADDAVLAGGLAATEYADHLVNIAAADRAASLLAAAGRRSTLGARIESILDTERKRNMLSRRMAVASIAAVLTIGVPVAAMQADKDVYSVKDPGVTPPQLIDKHEPPYTKEARAKKIEGAVILKVVVAADGTVSDVTVRKGLDDGLDANAVSAVKTWKFKPAEKDGQPVAVRATVEVNFRVR